MDAIKQALKYQEQDKASRKSIAEVASARNKIRALATDFQFETALTPPANAHLLDVYCGHTYRDPILVQFDPKTRTVYPVRK